MSAKISIGTALVLTALSATGAAAQTNAPYGSEAGWDIYVKSDMGPGCFMTREMTNATQVQMGIEATTNPPRGYMALYTTQDAAIAAGEKVPVVFDVDGQKFSGEATGQQMGGFVGAFVWVNNPDFIYDLAKKKALTITSKDREPILLSLEGTDAAFKALRACQEAQ